MRRGTKFALSVAGVLVGGAAVNEGTAIFFLIGALILVVGAVFNQWRNHLSVKPVLLAYNGPTGLRITNSSNETIRASGVAITRIVVETPTAHRMPPFFGCLTLASISLAPDPPNAAARPPCGRKIHPKSERFSSV
jgi:hypothetical protein